MFLRIFLDEPPRGIAAAGSLVCLLIGGFLSWHHPLDPILAVLAFFLWSTAVLLRPVIWVYVVPALLPVIDLAPWSGWLIVEEFDILVLGAAAGAYASMAVRHSAGIVASGTQHAPEGAASSEIVHAAPSRMPKTRLTFLSISVIVLYGVWTLFGLYRGIDAGSTWQFSWFDGYYDAANSLRIAKSYLLALLLLPPLLAEMRRSDYFSLDALATGLTAGLGLASLSILWERLAFPGFLNFSSDYRTTALFWEMHVGGAALDGFLVLTLPFAVREILRTPQRNRWPLTAAITGTSISSRFCRTFFPSQ